MWNRFSGKSNSYKDDLSSQSSRRNDDEQRQPARRSGSIASSNSNKKTSSRADDRDPRGFNPTSTSYSSTTREQYPGAASASIASSYAPASGNTNGEPYVAPGLVRNASLADQMPRSSLSRSSRDQDEARGSRDQKRDKTIRSDTRDQDIERRQKRDKRDKKIKGSRRSENGLDEEVGTSRGPGDFPDQVASSSFSQFPGQYDGAISGPNGTTPEHPAMSSHVQDQFPGQFPTLSSTPYRPPLAASEGGPGLAAEYYGDDGQSVAEQPGNRVDLPSLIIGAEPHLQPALAVAAPPPEPSASGAVGAAASFYSVEFEENEAASQQNSSSHVTGQIRPNSNYHSSSGPVIPTIGGTAIGSAAGYLINSQTSSHQHDPDHESSIGAPPSEYTTITTHRPPSQTQDSHYSSTSRPPKPGKQSSQSSNIPVYAAGIAGAAGLAAVAYEHNHHSSNQDFSSTPHYLTTSMAQRRRNQGPLGALVDFFKDSEGVALFEEYSQIIGVCRHCFAPGSSPRDAPRNHFYGRRRSNERYGSSSRIDKDSRYYSSENEGRRKSKSWLATGLAGYGLAKVGESLFKGKEYTDDTYSMKTGRFPADGRDRRTRRRSRSKERIEIVVAGDGRSDGKQLRGDIYNDTKTTTYSTRRHSRTKSRSNDRKTGLPEIAIGAALGTSVVASSSRRQSRSPQGTSVKSKHKGQAPSPERRPRTKKKKKDRGFFSFGNGSSSSSSVDLAYTGRQDKHRSNVRSNGKTKDDKKAEAALLGLGAAAAALALNDGRRSHRKKGVRELVGVKETIDHHGHGSAKAHTPKSPSRQLDDELWESAAEDDYESMNSDLAYGAPTRRDSRASFSSESSGINKWGWRWGSKKSRRASPPRRKSSDHSNFPAVAGTAGACRTGAAMTFPDQPQGSAMDSTSSLSLQHVYPVPTSDPSHFDVGREGSNASPNRPVISSRPEAVPLQHPRPLAPVSAAIYSNQTAYDHSYSAPTGPAVFSQTPYHHYPRTSDSTQEASIPGSFPRFEQQADDTARDFRIRRRDTSPARFGEDSISSSMAPRRRNAAKDDSSAVRFDLTEEQEEENRRERRRKRKQDKERREAEEQEQIEKDRHASKEQSSRPGSKTKPAEVPERSPEEPWIGPVAAGVIGATIGVATAAGKSRSEETREERRERRRRQRELEDEEDALSKSERRRRQRERDGQEATIKERGRLPDEISALSEDADRQGRSPEKQDMSVWQEAASTKRSSNHENYGAFFTPLELLNKSSDHVKITSANADADIDLEQVPQIVTVEPKRVHDLSHSPVFSLADTDDKIDLSKLSFPWQVPRLRLVEPTPPSTRGSTPIPQPRNAGDDGSEEPRKEPSPPKVKWEDDQTHEYTIIAPKEDHDEFIAPSSKEIRVTNPIDLSRSTHERDLADDETHPQNDLKMESSSASYGEDAEFAATLAASAEDAGFDPSIVINNPAYRRRVSPPGSNEGSMPDGFDGEDESRLNKKERKRKGRASRRQRQNDGLNERDDNAVVQDIISQVEESESQPLTQVPSENFDDEWESTKNIRSKKTKKGRKGSEPEDDFFEASETTSMPLDSESRDVYEPPTEDVRSIASSTPISNEAETGKRSRKKSKWDSTGFDDAVSTASSPSTIEAGKDSKFKSKDKRKGSNWDRGLGRSTGSLPQENGPENVAERAILKDFEEPKKKSKKSKELKSTGDGDDDQDSKERNSIAGTTPQVSGRISQDLPAKDQGTSLPPAFSKAGSVAQYLDHGVEPEQVQEKQPDSFLGMRPEPPPPPDRHAGSEELFDPLETTSLPTSPRPESETQNRRFSDAEISNPTQTTVTLPSSPTAVPFRFRRKGRSSSTARSLSQTPLSSNKSAADILPKQKTRPRSTEFKSSKEIRPLWLVERHRSSQEPTPDEIYPSLPSSHTTSRSSSVHNLEGGERQQRGNYELKETEHEPTEVEPRPRVSADSHPIRSDRLDSQKATPTASPFQDSSTVQDLLSLQASRDPSPKAFAEENPQHSSSTLKSAVLGAILGGSAALALNEAVQNSDLSRTDLSREENEEFEHGSDEMVPDTATYQSDNDSLVQEQDFVPQKTKKGKKNKREAGQSQQQKVQLSLTGDMEPTPSTNVVDAEPFSPESMRQLQEQDAQDAMDSWSPSALPSKKGKKAEKGKGKGLVERLQEESEQSPNTYEPSRDSLETTVLAEVQESDTLTREMPREQIVHIMTAAAQDATKDKNEASQTSTAVVQEPFEIPRDDLPQSGLHRESLSKDDPPHGEVPYEIHQKARPQGDVPQGEFLKDGLSQDNLPQDDLPQDDLPQDDLHRETFSKDDPPHDEFPPDVQQKTHPQGDFPQGEFPRDDFSKSQGNLPQDEILGSDLRQNSPPALSLSAPAKVTFLDPFSEQGHENVLQSSNAPPASQEEFDRGDLTTISPQLELSPKATPLPDGDDDHDLLDERLGTPIPSNLYHFDEKEMKIAAETPSDIPHIEDPSGVKPESGPGPQKQLQELPAQVEKVDADDYFAAPSKKKSKKGKKANQSVSVEDNKSTEIQDEDGPLPMVVISKRPEDDWPKDLNDEPGVDVPQEKFETGGDEWGGFISKKNSKKEKKAKQSFSAENSKTTEIQEGQESLPDAAVSDAPEHHEAISFIDGSAFGVPQPKTEPLEDEWTGFNGKKKGKKGKKIKPSFSVKTIMATEIGDENEPQSTMATSQAAEIHEARDLIDEPAVYAPKSEAIDEEPKDLIDVLTKQAPKPEVIEDKWARSDSKNRSENIEKQNSTTLNLGPRSDETVHQFERQRDARDDMSDRPSALATTQKSGEVSAMLRLGENEVPIGGELKEAFPKVSQTEHNPRKSSEDQISTHESETPRFEDAPGKALDDETSPTLDTSVAGTNAAQAVQDILAIEDNAESAADVKREVMLVSTGMEETGTDRPIEEDRLDWDAPKKKKGKKGKKNEASSWDEAETIEPAEVSGTPEAMNTSLRQEPAADRPIEEDELDRDASKKEKKGKRGKKNEASSWDEAETNEPAEVSGTPEAMNTSLRQEPAADRPIEEDELDRDAPKKKKKKGKRGKKSEVFSLDEPEIIEPAELSGPPAVMKPPQLEQEPPIKAIDEVSSKQSKKERRDKKGKGKGVSRTVSNFRDEDEPNVVPTAAPQDDRDTRSLSSMKNDYQDEVKPIAVPSEAPQENDRMGDFLTGASDIREEVRPSVILIEAPRDDDRVKDLPAGGMPPTRAELRTPGEVLEPAVPPELAQNDEDEKYQEAALGEEQDIMPPKSKRDRKKSKRSKKANAFSLDDDEIPTVGEGQISGTKDFEKDGAEQSNLSIVNLVEESEKAAQKKQLKQEEDFMLPTNKKAKKKSKKFSPFPLDNDVSLALEDEPVFKTDEAEKEAPEQTHPSSVDVAKEYETLIGGRPQEKTTPELNKNPEVDSNINPLSPSGVLVVEGKGGEPVYGYFDSVSAHAAALVIPHKSTSSVTSSLEQPANTSDAIAANQANELEENIGPAVETHIDPLYSIKQSQEDKNMPKNAPPLIWEEDEDSQEPRAVLKESSATEDPERKSIITVSQDSESRSEPGIYNQEIESMEIVRPAIRSGEDHGFQESVLEEQPSQAGDGVPTMVEAEHEGSFTDVNKGKNGKRTKREKLSDPDLEEDRSAADEKELASLSATSFIQGIQQKSEQQPRDDLNPAGEIRSNQENPAAGSKKEQDPVLTEPAAIAEAKDIELLWDVPAQRAERNGKNHNETQRDDPEVVDLSSSAAPEPTRATVETVRNTEPITNMEPLGSLDKDEPIPALEVDMLDTQEQREYDEEYIRELERAAPSTEPVADSELLGGPNKGRPNPAVEVEMLDAQEQRDYNEEYAKELERQLSPLQEGERADPSLDEADAPVFSQASIASVMERPYKEEHRPLARPPALEDIIEESRSRPGSVQGTPADREDTFTPFKSTKDSKKGKKGKKQEPVIWEDETATPLLEPQSDQGAKPSIRSSGGPGLWEIDAARSLDLEEPVERRSLEDKTIASPIRDFSTTDNDTLTEMDWLGDYFAIQPRRPAEEDVGMEDNHEFRQALSTEPPYSTRDQSPAQEPQIAQASHPRDDAIKAINQDEEFGSLVTDFHDKSRTEAEPAEEKAEDNFDPAPIKNIKKGKKSKKKASAREPSPQALGQEDFMDRPQDLEAPTTDTLNERSPSRQHFSQPSLREEDEQSLVAEGRPTSSSRSGSLGGVAAAVGLGVSQLVAENFSKRDSKEERRRGKTGKEAGRWTDAEAEIDETESSLDRGELAIEEQEHRQTPESKNAVREWQHHQATPPQSPPAAKYEAIADHPVVGDLGQSSETPQYRDSAIYVSGSPMVSEETPYHRAVRDSGYPDTEASPVVDNKLETPDDPTDLESGVAADARFGHVQHRHSPAHETDERRRSTSRNPHKMYVEADSDYDVSASRPKEERKRSRRRSEAAYDSDDSADSGFDIQRRRRRQAMAGEPREPSPVSSTTKNRSSALFDSSPSAREETVAKPQDQDVSPQYNPVRKEPTWSVDREGSPQQGSREDPEPTNYEIPTGNHEDTGTSLFGDPRSYEDDFRSLSRSPRSSESRGRQRLNTISEDSANGSPLHKKDKRALSDIGSPGSGVKGRRMRSPPVEDDVAEEHVSTYDQISRQAWPAADREKHALDERSRSRNSDQLSTFSSRHSGLSGVTPRHREAEYRTASAASIHSENSVHAIIRTPDQVRSASGLSYRSSGTPPLRRVDRSASGDLRGASKKSDAKNRAKSSSELEAELDIGIPSSSTYDPVTDKGKSRADMADVYEGWGDVRGQSPMSPTRPPSMRKRQSMQLLDLETRLDQIVSENRLLASQKLTAEKALQEQARDHSQGRRAYEEAMQEHKMYLTRKDSELSELKQIIEQLHNQAAHLTEVNEGLASSRSADDEHRQRYSRLRAEHANTHEQWQQSTRELENLKEQHTQLSTGMEDIVRHEVTVALEEKNLELRQLQNDLEKAKQQVRNLQQQLLASKNSDDFVERDEDYFDSQCQSLCQHVQQWVLRFSKFSDMKACYLASEIRDEKVVDRMENAILDGSDVDDYLRDRVKRRDVFMSVVMTMIWEFIFTRYLFGMDREQRQKLKNLEKTLQEVGPISAVQKWRATTLTLLMKREAFETQRATDTEAVVHEIYDTLATFLPPPSHLVGQIQDSLRKVIDSAVDLSVEMRTQRAEYSMLPPLQPEYDTSGDLARKVYFSALTMNERSGATSSNEALQEQHAVVRMVLFPLVVKNEDDDEQIVVCPAQVLTAEGSKGKKTVRVMSAQGGRSEASFAGSDVRMEGGMI